MVLNSNYPDIHKALDFKSTVRYVDDQTALKEKLVPLTQASVFIPFVRLNHLKIRRIKPQLRSGHDVQKRTPDALQPSRDRPLGRSRGRGANVHT